MHTVAYTLFSYAVSATNKHIAIFVHVLILLHFMVSCCFRLVFLQAIFVQFHIHFVSLENK